MKSVKSKLFFGFTVVIFIILLVLSFISIKLFSFTQESELFTQIDQTMSNTYTFIEKNSDTKIRELDRFIELRNQFVVIIKNEKLLYTSESNYKTNKILQEAYDEFEDDEHDYKERDERKHHDKKKREDKSHRKVVDDDFLILYEELEKEYDHYEIFTGLDERVFDNHLDDVILGIFTFALIVFLLLLGVGYMLIKRTINPLKLILDELVQLRSAQDLTKRLEVQKSNDEFESLTLTLNTMLDNIERSVENIKQFSSDASHELKTPLTIIQGQIELSQDKNLSVEELKEVIEKINCEQKKLQEIIQNFLLLSRLEKQSINVSKCNLDMVVFDCVESHLEQLESKSLELKLDIDENLGVNFESRYLLIVLSNLLSNAIKYTHEGSITLKAFKKNRHTYFVISDTGIGIDANHVDKIFERFFRVDKARSEFSLGVGLGLSIVKKICDRFNTTISVESELNKGTKITLQF